MAETTAHRVVESEPWKDRSKLKKPTNAEAILFSLAVIVSSLGIAFFRDEQISYFFLLPLLFFTVWGLRSPGSVTVVLLTAFLGSLIVASLSGAVAVLAIVVGVGSLSWLLTVSGRPYAAALPIAVALAFWIVTRDVTMTLLSVSFLPSAILLSIATVTHQRRTTAICFAIGGLLVSVLVGLALFFYAACGTLELSAIKEYLEGTRAWLLDLMLGARDTFLDAMRESLIAEGMSDAETGATLGRFSELLTPALLEEVIFLFFSILPALCVMAASVVAFEAQIFLNVSYYRTGRREVLTLQASVFSMSIVSAVIYVVGFLLTMFIDTTVPVGATIQNVTLMLLPGFCVMGWGAILGALRTAKGGQRAFLILLLLFTVCCSGLSVLYFLALWGAYAAIMTALHMNMAEKLFEMGKAAQDRENRESNENSNGDSNGSSNENSKGDSNENSNEASNEASDRDSDGRGDE